MTNIEPNYPAFDTAKPTDAERIAELEARVTALEALLDVDDFTEYEPGMPQVTVTEFVLTDEDE